MSENYTTTLGPPLVRQPWWKSFIPDRYSAAQFLINKARKLSGRKSIGEEFLMGNPYKRKMSNPLPFWMGGFGRQPAAKRRKIMPKKTASKNPAPGGPITTQYDYKVSRGKKRLSKRQKKWKTFVKKVHKATDENEKTHFLVEANNAPALINGSAGASLQQILPTSAAGTDYNLQLCPIGNIATGPLLFVDNLIQQMSVIPTTGGLPVAAVLNDIDYKLLGASCTASIKNVTIFNIFIDIYECVASSNVTDANYNSARLAWLNALALNIESDAIAARTNLLSTMSGCTPYQAPGFAKYWKIIKKTRVLAGPGSKTNYTYFTKGRNVKVAKTLGQYATKGLTKDLIIVVNPTYNGDTVAAAPQINVEWSKTYAVKVPKMPGLQSQWAYQIVY